MKTKTVTARIKVGDAEPVEFTFEQTTGDQINEALTVAHERDDLPSPSWNVLTMVATKDQGTYRCNVDHLVFCTMDDLFRQ